MSKKNASETASKKVELIAEELEQVSGAGDLDSYVNGKMGEAFKRGYNSCHGTKQQRNAAGNAAKKAAWSDAWNRGYNQLNLRN